MCGWLKLNLKKCVVGKIFKTFGWIVCRQSKSVYSCQDVKVRFSDVYFFGVWSFSMLAYNVLQLPEGGDL
jgi:hypothetical protein